MKLAGLARQVSLLVTTCGDNNIKLATTKPARGVACPCASEQSTHEHSLFAPQSTNNDVNTQLINRHDVCLLSETWTNVRCDLSLPGYNYKAIHRTIKKRGTVRDSGGLLLHFKSELKDAVEI